MAQYNVYFMSYADANVQLRTILRDQLEYMFKDTKKDDDQKVELKIEGKVLDVFDKFKVDFTKMYPDGEEG